MASSVNESSDDRVDEHVVFFTTALGDPAAERYPSLRAAVSRVETLCNDEDVQDAKVYQLVPVPLNVRPYYRVEVEDGAPRPPRMERAAQHERPAPPERRPEPRLREDDVRRLRDEVAPPSQARAEDYEMPTRSEPAGPAAKPEEPEGRSLGFFVH